MVLEVPASIILNNAEIVRNLKAIYDVENKSCRIIGEIFSDEKIENIDLSIVFESPKLSLSSMSIKIRGYENIRKIPFGILCNFVVLKRKWEIKGTIGNEDIFYANISSWIQVQELIFTSIFGILKNQLKGAGKEWVM